MSVRIIQINSVICLVLNIVLHTISILQHVSERYNKLLYNKKTIGRMKLIYHRTNQMICTMSYIDIAVCLTEKNRISQTFRSVAYISELIVIYGNMAVLIYNCVSIPYTHHNQYITTNTVEYINIIGLGILCVSLTVTEIVTAIFNDVRYRIIDLYVNAVSGILLILSIIVCVYKLQYTAWDTSINTPLTLQNQSNRLYHKLDKLRNTAVLCVVCTSAVVCSQLMKAAMLLSLPYDNIDLYQNPSAIDVLQLYVPLAYLTVYTYASYIPMAVLHKQSFRTWYHILLYNKLPNNTTSDNTYNSVMINVVPMSPPSIQTRRQSVLDNTSHHSAARTFSVDGLFHSGKDNYWAQRSILFNDSFTRTSPMPHRRIDNTNRLDNHEATTRIRRDMLQTPTPAHHVANYPLYPGSPPEELLQSDHHSMVQHPRTMSAGTQPTDHLHNTNKQESINIVNNNTTGNWTDDYHSNIKDISSTHSAHHSSTTPLLHQRQSIDTSTMTSRSEPHPARNQSMVEWNQLHHVVA